MFSSSYKPAVGRWTITKDNQPNGVYRLTPAGLARARGAARAIDEPWKLSCRMWGRRNRARTRARAHDFAVADALTAALDLACRLGDEYLPPLDRSGSGRNASSAINRAVEHASLLEGAFAGFDPDAYRSFARGMAGFNARERARDSAEGPADMFEATAIDSPSPLTQPIRAVARAIISDGDFRRAAATDQRFDIFRARRRSFLRLVDVLRPRYVRLDALDDHRYETLGDIDELIRALRSTRDLYLSARAPA